MQRRVVAGAMAEALGRGGKTAVAEASGLGRNTVTKASGRCVVGSSRRIGCGRRGRVTSRRSTSSPACSKRSMSWCSPRLGAPGCRRCGGRLKSTYELARELTAKGYRVSAELVRRLLHQMGYSLQAPAKQNEGAAHPDRDGQFRYLNGSSPSVSRRVSR